MRVTGHTRMARWGGAILVALAPLPWLGLGTATAAAGAVYATVDGHEPFSSDANHPDYWGDNCTKVGGGAFSSYVLTEDQAKVIVKAGAGQYANTIFLDASAGETVWADTNGDGIFNPGGRGGDKQISHIITCDGGGQPTPSTTKPTPTTTKPTPTTTSATPTTTKPTPTTTRPTTPTTTQTSSSGSASPSTTKPTTPTTTIETGTSEPGDKNTKDPSASVKPTHLTQPAALPATGPGMPVGTALAISLLLIGLGALLLLGPGRLAAERYHRKH